MNTYGKILFAIVLPITLFSFSCKKEEFNGHKYKIFTLKQGEHYSCPREVSAFFDHKMRFHAKFDDSAQYPKQDPSTRGVNKLFGFSDCGNQHHEDGARFGWEWYDNELKIYGYTYVNGNLKFEYITSVPLNQEVTYTIDTSGSQYIFSVDSPNGFKSLTMERGCSGNGGAKYKDGPYFGGKETAPHDIKIIIDEMKY